MFCLDFLSRLTASVCVVFARLHLSVRHAVRASSPRKPRDFMAPSPASLCV